MSHSVASYVPAFLGILNRRSTSYLPFRPKLRPDLMMSWFFGGQCLPTRPRRGWPTAGSST